MYKQITQLAPDDADTYNSIGDTLDILYRYEEAIAAYEKAISINPNNAIAYNNMGATLNRQNRH